MLWLEPQSDPPDAIDNLLNKILKFFPQCNDQIRKSKCGKYIPHLSLARFKTEAELLSAKMKLEENWTPISFLVKEIYMMSRIKINPFEVMEVLPLGNDTTPPHFGAGSILTDESEFYRTLVVCEIPRGISDEQLLEIFLVENFSACRAEVNIDIDWKRQHFGVVVFETRQETERAAENFMSKKFPEVYVRYLWKMAYPDVIEGTCSLAKIKNL